MNTTIGGNLCFGNAVNYGVGITPEFVAVGDLNGDGKPDLAVANLNSNSISVLLNNGNGSFVLVVNYGVNSPSSVAVGDLNGDGRLDLVTTDTGTSTDPGTVSVLLNNGSGFANPAIYSEGPSRDPRSVVVADLNGDGKPDLAVANDYGGGLVGLLLIP